MDSINSEAIIEYEGITGVAIFDQNNNLLIEKGNLQGMLLSEDIGTAPAIQGRIDVAFSKDPLQTGLNYILMAGVLLLMIFVPAFVLIIWKISRFYLYDITKLTECVSKSSCEELHKYPGINRNDEVGLLAKAMQERDLDLSAYHQELEGYKNHLEQLVEQRTKELKRSEMLSQTILNSIPDSIALVDAGSFAILNANDAFLKNNRKSMEEVLGKPCFEISHGTEEPCAGIENTCPIQEYINSNQPCVAEHLHTNSAGEQYYVEVSAWPVFDEDNTVSQMVHVERDITEKKKVEELREDVERIVRHDLKTPLNGIIGLSEILADDVTLGAEQKEFAQLINDSGHRMLHMINQSLDLFKMEEGTYKLNSEKFDLLQAVETLKKETQKVRSAKNIDLEVLLDSKKINEDEQVMVFWEERHIQSMLSNLISNAIEASPSDSYVSLNIMDDNGVLTMDIHNQGEIPEEIRDSFFERYVTSGKTHGTGLGTFSARLVARGHKGDITFNTSAKEGTHVVVTIPVNPDEG
ncbi:MAG: PAS domain-containing sensor histidine kinase [Desulfovibrionales bacterium]|nr:PAS domain-containing sensor histidine kinase [Desulfovibrionales bacterium]